MAKRILNLVGWLGLALVVAAVAIRFGMPAKDQYAYYLAWAGLVSVLAYSISQWREFAALFSRRQARYGTLAGVSVLVVLGILIAINYIGAKQHKRWDLTTNKVFSLSDQTRNILAKLDAPLHITVFAQEADFPRYQDRLQEYGYVSKQVSTDYVDPDKQPALARQNQIQQYGTILFQYKGRTERVTSDAEQDITNGIIKVTTGQEKQVYFTQGHGERDTTSSERDGYNAIAQALGRENYKVEKLVLAQTGSVPADASVVVIAGPQTDFFPPEVDALKKYLAGGGKLLLMLDPPAKADSAPHTNLLALAHDWGMDVGRDVVVDVSGMGRLIGASEAVPVAASYPSHPITQRFSLLTAYPLARSVTPVPSGVDGHTAQSVAETGPQSWAETDLDAVLNGKPVSFNEGKDKKGPISIAAAVSATATPASAAPAKKGEEPPKAETRVVVFGDSDFASNSALGVQGNRDLFMNTIGWLSQQENLISIRPKEPDDRRLTMTAAQVVNMFWLSIVIIPACIFGAGIYTWSRRR
ncbi:MAG: GldG family protein [Betaproteobacteria bacterium]